MLKDLTTTRFRERDSRSQTFWKTESHFPDKETVVSQSLPGIAGEYKSIADCSLPGYRAKRRQGQVVLQDCHLYTWNREVTNGSLQEGPISKDGILGKAGSYALQSGDLARTVEGHIEWPTSPLGDHVGSYEAAALIDATAKVKDSAVLGGETFSDLSKTISMFRRPFSSAQRLITKTMSRKAYWMIVERARYGHLPMVERVQRATSKAWLETRYGWLPIIGDANAILKQTALARQHLDEQLQHRLLVARASKRGLWNKDSSFESSLVYEYKAKGSLSVDHTLKVDAGVLYHRKMETQTDYIMRSLGLRLTDIPATMWEVVPYSFVMDWFVNLGPWIRAMTPDPNTHIIGNWVTTVSKYTNRLHGGEVRRTLRYDVDNQTWYTFTGSYGSSVTKQESFTRQTNCPLPSHPVYIPHFGCVQAIDAVSLTLGRVISALGKLRH